MKNKTIFILVIAVFIITSFTINHSYANENDNPTYNFYIKNNEAVTQNLQNILFDNTVSEKTLINKKIAPGTSGGFNVNIDISNGVVSKYNIKFTNFSKDFPKNLKFYFNGAEIDLKTFSLTDIQSSKKVSYEFTWKWEYETEDNIKGDEEDTFSSKIDSFNFDISLTAEYEEIDVTGKLPRSGDIVTNF